MPNHAQQLPVLSLLPGQVVNLGAARELLRLRRYRERVDAITGSNRRALNRLFESGMVFTRSGSKAGRDLLRAHQNLLKVADLLGRTEEHFRDGAGMEPEELESLFRQLDEMLDQSSVLARRHKKHFLP